MPLQQIRPDPAALDALNAHTVAVVGYGNQGRAHALNLRDSGRTVVIGQRPGRSFQAATDDGFEPVEVAIAVQRADLIVVGLPDERAGDVYTEAIELHLSADKSLGFIHGFNIRFGYIKPPADIDVIMVAPKGPGSLLRSLYVEGKGLPALVAVEQDATGQARDTAIAWAAGIGSTRAALIETTFANETETDLFGEQAVLCGGVSALCKAAFETLTDAGYPPELAYLECVHELKQVVDLIYEAGLTAMRDRVSNTAEYGDLTRGPRIVDDHVRKEMRAILEEIRTGRFANEWITETRNGMPTFNALHNADADTPFEQAGAEVRRLMPWLNRDAQ